MSVASWSAVCPLSMIGAPVVDSNLTQAKPKHGSVPALTWTVWQTLMSLSTLVKPPSIPQTVSTTWVFCSTVHCPCVSTLPIPRQLVFSSMPAEEITPCSWLPEPETVGVCVYSDTSRLLADLPDSAVAPLQRVLHAAARFVADIGPLDHITPTLLLLHWLPVRQRIICKLCSVYCYAFGRPRTGTVVHSWHRHSSHVQISDLHTRATTTSRALLLDLASNLLLSLGQGLVQFTIGAEMHCCQLYL